MDAMLSDTTLVALAIFAVAGLVKGVTGMGLPTVAMGLLGTVMAPVAAAAIVLVPSFATNVWQMLNGPALPALWRRLWPMMLGIAVGAVSGSALIVEVDSRRTAAALGAILIGYAAYALYSPTLAVPARHERWLGPLVGLLTGIATGATGVSVIPSVPYLQALRLERDELVQALGLAFTISALALAVGLASRGALGLGQIGLSLLVILPSLVGMTLGQLIRKRISPRGFRLCFLAFLIVLGLNLLARVF